MRPVGEGNAVWGDFLKDHAKIQNPSETQSPKDHAEISNTSRAFAKLDNFLNLGKPDRLDVSDLNSAEKKEFLNMLAALLKKGVIGYEILEVNGRPEKHYIVNEIGDERLNNAKLYTKKGYYKD